MVGFCRWPTPSWPGVHQFDGSRIRIKSWVDRETQTRMEKHRVNVGGDVHPITVSLRAIYDPGNQRIR